MRDATKRDTSKRSVDGRMAFLCAILAVSLVINGMSFLDSSICVDPTIFPGHATFGDMPDGMIVELGVVRAILTQDASQEEFDALAQMPYVQAMEIISNQIEGASGYVFDSKIALKELVISSRQFDRGMAAIGSHCKSLETLHLLNGGISDESLEAITDLPLLDVLTIQSKHVTDNSVTVLSSLTGLSFLDVSLCSISEEGVSELKVNLADTTVIGP